MAKDDGIIRYEEHHLKPELVAGIAWNHDRVWFCVDGLAVFRAKVVDGKLVPEYNKPESIKELER